MGQGARDSTQVEAGRVIARVDFHAALVHEVLQKLGQGVYDGRVALQGEGPGAKIRREIAQGRHD